MRNDYKCEFYSFQRLRRRRKIVLLHKLTRKKKSKYLGKKWWGLNGQRSTIYIYIGINFVLVFLLLYIERDLIDILIYLNYIVCEFLFSVYSNSFILFFSLLINKKGFMSNEYISTRHAKS